MVFRCSLKSFCFLSMQDVWVCQWCRVAAVESSIWWYRPRQQRRSVRLWTQGALQESWTGNYRRRSQRKRYSVSFFLLSFLLSLLLCFFISLPGSLPISHSLSACVFLVCLHILLFSVCWLLFPFALNSFRLSVRYESQSLHPCSVLPSICQFLFLCFLLGCLCSSKIWNWLWPGEQVFVFSLEIFCFLDTDFQLRMFRPSCRSLTRTTIPCWVSRRFVMASRSTLISRGEVFLWDITGVQP